MPYESVDDLPDYIKSKPAKTQRQWMAVWNSSYAACMKDGGGAAKCEGAAFARANGVIKGAEDSRTIIASDLSFDQVRELLYAALHEDEPPILNPAVVYDCWVRDVYDDYCIVSKDNKLYKRAYVVSEDKAVLGAPIPVVEHRAYIPVPATSAMYSEAPFQVFIKTSIFDEDDFSKPQWIPFLPKPGKFTHPLYGEVIITAERNQELVDSVKNKVYQENIPLDIEHESKLSGAVGWIQDMRLNDDESGDAYVEWTDRGRALLKGGQFKYISPEWFPSWRDPVSGVVHQNVIAGGALTTRPFFKERVLRALVASEGGTEIIPGVEDFADGFRDFSPEQRDEMAKSGVAMPDGSYPIPDEDALSRAIQSIGRATNRAAVMAHIKKRAKALGKTDVLPEDWSEKERHVADNEEKTYTAIEVDDKIKEATQPFTEQMTALQGQLAEAQALAASEKTAREAIEGRLAESEKAERLRKFTDLIAGRGGESDGAPWAGDPEKHVAILERLTSQFGPNDEVVESYIEQQTAAAKQFKEAGLFKEFGTSAPAISDPEKKLDSLAKAHAEKTPGMTFQQAYAEVLQTEEGKRLYGETVK
jgi:hypothetical protein